VAGRRIGAHLLRLGRARDHRRDRGHRGEAADRDLEQRHAVLPRERLEALDPVVLLVRDLLAGETRPLRRRRTAVVLAGEETAREREVRDEAEPEPLAGWQQLALGVAREPRVLALLRHV